MFGTILKKSAPLARSICTSAVRQSSHDTRGIIGSNVPFPVHNKLALTLTFTFYFGSGLTLPFLIILKMSKQASQ